MTMERREGLGMPDGEVGVEILHPCSLNGALGAALGHSSTQIMDDPIVREGHVAGKCLPLDEYNSLFVVKEIRPAKIDKGRDVKLRSSLTPEPRSQLGGCRNTCHAISSMRADGANDEWK
jgi:hypothetical protein